MEELAGAVDLVLGAETRQLGDGLIEETRVRIRIEHGPTIDNFVPAS